MSRLHVNEMTDEQKAYGAWVEAVDVENLKAVKHAAIEACQDMGCFCEFDREATEPSERCVMCKLEAAIRKCE